MNFRNILVMLVVLFSFCCIGVLATELNDSELKTLKGGCTTKWQCSQNYKCGGYSHCNSSTIGSACYLCGNQYFFGWFDQKWNGICQSWNLYSWNNCYQCTITDGCRWKKYGTCGNLSGTGYTCNVDTITDYSCGDSIGCRQSVTDPCGYPS